MLMSVPDQGSLQAEILLVGEAPGKNAVQWGKPFGNYQHELRYWWRHAGIDPRDVYLTYVYNKLPQAKKYDLGLAVKTRKVTQESIYAGQDDLKDLASRMPNLKIIVPLGDFGMSAFTSYGKCPTNPMATASHKQVRGSVYNTQDKNGRDLKVIGTHAPHQIQAQSQLTFRTMDDWKRIHEQRSTPFPFEAPFREHNIHPSLEECEDFARGLTKNDVVSIDIETWGNELKCIGFSTDEKYSLVIPTTKPHVGDKLFGSQNGWWQVINDICMSPAEKLAQNGLFDAWWMLEYGISLKGYWWDTLAMHHCLNSLDSHSLEYMTSVLTLQPYYKDEAKEADEIVKVAKSSGMDKLYVYNGLDVLVTHEVFQKLYDQLEKRGMLQFYLRHYADMNAPLLGMMRGGVPVNKQTVESERIRLMDEAVLHRDKASKIAGKPMWTFKATKCERDMLEYYWVMAQEGDIDVNALQCALLEQGHKGETIERKWADMQNKGVSDAMLTEVLYTDWKCPSGKQTESGRDKADNIALKGLQNAVTPRKRAPRGYEGPVEEWVSNVVSLVDETLASRRAKKLSSFVDPAKVDPDDRLRCSYKYTTKTGRLASASNPRGTGMNLQNIDREMRHPFEATPGRVLMECDLSQAEGRVVGVLTGNEEMIRLARRLPTEGDDHTENAMLIFKIPFELAKEKKYRNPGKRTTHASNYGMRGQTMSDQLLKDGYVFTPKECQAMIDTYAAARPALREWQSTVRRTMLRKQGLFTSWGRAVSFKHLALDDELFRFGYSYVPQSEIGDLLNQQGLKPLNAYLERYKMKSELVLQVHDSVVLNAVPEEMYDIMQLLAEELPKPRVYGEVYGVEEALSIPVEFGIGKTWQKAVEWKGFPTKEEVNETVAELLTA